MKTKIVFTFLILTAMLCHGQSRQDIFNSEVPLTWLGLDFSEARFIGDRERLGSESDIHKLMTALNQLMIDEAEKYAMDKPTDRPKDKVKADVSVTSSHNDELDVSSMISDDPKDFTRVNKNTISEVISSYDFKGNSGLGVMFNIESFSKPESKGSMFVTFINMDTKEVLFTERMEAPAKGFGLRNYWAGSVYGVMEAMKKKTFEAWRKKSS